MNREYHRWYSPHLGRDMELLVFGHGGTSVVVFPTSMGAFFEYEDRGMVGALADKLRGGALQLYCVSSVDLESWYNRAVHPRDRIDRALAYEQYLLNEVVPLIQHKNPQATLGVTGCSFGAYHAMAFALRHPDLVSNCITLGGSYDIHQFLDGYYDQDCYFLCPPDFLPNLGDEWYLDRYRTRKWVLATGEHDICRRENERMSHLLSVKRIPHSLHVWAGSWHDWLWWQRMAQAYVP
jgi:esterase/lipase superfamily enzyme